MGTWVMHIEGHGIHDNGREDDADAMLKEFASKLAVVGHEIRVVTFTLGTTRELPASNTGRVESPNEWRPVS
jgi:hypothetical protein